MLKLGLLFILIFIRTKNQPQIDITARTTHVVTSGKYLMKTKAIRAAINIRYICCNRIGPSECTDIIPTIPKFHKITTKEIKSRGMLNATNISLFNKTENFIIIWPSYECFDNLHDV